MAQLSTNHDSRPACGLETKAGAMIRRPFSSLVLYAVLLAIWAVPGRP
jgi:hypothetical protein